MQQFNAATLGHVVQYLPDGPSGDMPLWGIAEHLTPDGWVGIRQCNGRLDEVPAALVYLDPT